MGREDEVLKVERRKIAELKNDPANARKHSPRNLKAIRDSLDVFGQQKPIVVDSRGVVIAGNGTLEAARELGWDEINVTVTDLDPAHAQAFGIADNRTAELAEWDTDVLGQLLEGMDSDLADILSIDDLELPDSIDGGEQGEGLTDPDEVPEPPEEPITQTGDLWLLGEHRLLCGDSTSAEDVGRLMDGEEADMLLSDPPYGVSYHSNKKGKKLARIEGDLTQAAIPVSFSIACDLVLDENGRVYLFGGTANWPMYTKLFDHKLMMQPRPMIWVKEGFILHHTHYHSQFEVCFFGWKGVGGGKGFWFGDRKGSDVWNVSRDNISERFHPTQKPIGVCSIPIGNSCPSNGIVYDPFLGSGTTLIAAEQLGRKCYGMEIDPKYCDVIVKRWEDFTGQTATRETASQTATRENERT